MQSLYHREFDREEEAYCDRCNEHERDCICEDDESEAEYLEWCNYVGLQP
jgi:hypothetical protein